MKTDHWLWSIWLKLHVTSWSTFNDDMNEQQTHHQNLKSSQQLWSTNQPTTVNSIEHTTSNWWLFFFFLIVVWCWHWSEQYHLFLIQLNHSHHYHTWTCIQSTSYLTIISLVWIPSHQNRWQLDQSEWFVRDVHWMHNTTSISYKS